MPRCLRCGESFPTHVELNRHREQRGELDVGAAWNLPGGARR